MSDSEPLERPYHAGEIEVQIRAGGREAAQLGARRSIRGEMLDRHRAFFASLPYVFIGTADDKGRPWASVLAGPPGFMTSPCPKRLRLEATLSDSDPAAAGLRPGASVALVGVELQTRRRNRMNGVVVDTSKNGIEVEVRQAFGNCPQYIQQRNYSGRHQNLRPTGRRLAGVDAEARRILETADACFMASVAPDEGNEEPSRGVDVNHKGGRPGFLRVEKRNGSTFVLLPDFIGNFFFNTLGNIAVNGVAGLFAPDFTSGSAVSLTGQARIIWAGEQLEIFAGAERLIEIAIDEIWIVEDVLPRDWDTAEEAPELPSTGTWREVQHALQRNNDGDHDLDLEVVSLMDECEGVRSIVLASSDRKPLPMFKPGQYLPIVLKRGPGEKPLHGTYSISSEPARSSYRISVSLASEGNHDSVSAWLHANISVGDKIKASRPRGGFHVDTKSPKAILLIGAGIGVTPLVAMAQTLTSGTDDRGRSPDRPVILIHAVRNGSRHPFRNEILARAQQRRNFFPAFVYSAPTDEDKLQRAFHFAGHLDRGVLRSLLPLDDYEVFVCGPSSFMQDIYDALRSLGVDDQSIHSEAFGRSAIKRSVPEVDATQRRSPSAARITFARSCKSGMWKPDTTILDIAEELSIDAPYGCREGRCGQCEIRLLAGAVRYDREALAIGTSSALICCAHPIDEEVVLDL
ncbi:2Fe-2S iron-sulfur cluster binding domain-containing protein [Rhizobium tropici]|uniref:2Fe-2S iron-sulfur cluster binding domain-containing protein n=1 Tax=Rhizobium tropici TaxID=398 RepID=A0A5B0W7X4_RHITR|nr:pyridoxamine 5'-phosphate oxidase family protein [Rhizobium tropici]KAA1183066.1 2Fe-2S iron-sulfur cluster binding domain-containing protein [Rhizobium tropici]